MLYRVIVIGSGCAGLTAAIYAARANLGPLVIAGREPGGQLTLTTDVENFPGFPEGIQGPELMEKMRKQAERFGAAFVDGDVTSVSLSQRPFRVEISGESYEAESIIVASGASARWLGLKSEQRLRGRGVSACATCDGFFFKGRDVIVVGGGDSAMEEALFLTKFASSVEIVHRRDKLRASKIMQDRASRNPKISFIWNSIVTEVLGDGSVTGVRLKNIATGEDSEVSCGGLFVAIGHAPNTDMFRGQLELDKDGYIVVRNETESSMRGVFVAGDVSDRRYRQAVTAAASGCQAAMDAEKYLEMKEYLRATA